MSARKQVKFSGLVGAGTITRNSDPESERQFPSNLEQIAASQTAAQALTLTEPIVSANWELVDEQVVPIAVALVDDSPFQTEEDFRDRYDPEGIDELAHTMANAGQQEPIIVRWTGGRFELIAGHRRIRAARSLGWEQIRALVVRKDDIEAEKSVMVHNEGRQELSDYAKARLYKRAKDKGYAKTQSDLAHMFATKQSSVSKRLAMLTLPDPIIKMLEAKKDIFSMNTAAVIHELLDEHPAEIGLISQAVERIKTENANENSIRGWVAQMLQSKARTLPSPNRKPKVITDPAGRQLYTAKLEGRVITLRVSALELDPDATLDKLVEFFQAAAKTESAGD